MRNISTITERSLEHVAGVSSFDDSRGNKWGIRTFTLRHIGYFHSILFKALSTYNAGCPAILQRLAWTLFIQRCLCCHNPFLLLSVKARRALGLPDYSLFKVWHLSKMRAVPTANGVSIKALPKIIEPIIYATLDHKTLKEMLDKKDDIDDGKPPNWGEIVASFFIHKGMMPDAVLDLTIPQLNAIDETMKREQLRSAGGGQNAQGNIIDEIIASQNMKRRRGRG